MNDIQPKVHEGEVITQDPHLWTTETCTAEALGVPISRNTAPCSVAPRADPTATAPMPFVFGILPDGRRAYPFLERWEAQDITDRLNSDDFWEAPR